MPEKTESDVKIVWNSKLKKKLSAMGIDPVTHKPFSQILADYGSMGAFPRPRDLKGALQVQTSLTTAVKSEISDSDHLYSQLEAIEASSCVNEGSAAAQEASSFSWSDFFLEEAFAAQENGGQFGGRDDEISEVRKIDGGGGSAGMGFDASSSSSAFVEAMIGKQDEMCSQLPCFYEEPFYY